MSRLAAQLREQQAEESKLDTTRWKNLELQGLGGQEE